MPNKHCLTKEKKVPTTSPETAPTVAEASQREDFAELLVRYQPLIRVIVAKMSPNLPAHADFEELRSAGLTGLIHAIERFDPSRGYTFETYASIRIRGAILDELRRLDLVPRSVRRNQRRLAAAVEKLEKELGRAPQDSEIQAELGLGDRKYAKIRAQGNPLSILFLDAPVADGETQGHELLADEEAEAAPDRVETDELLSLVADKIHQLPEAQQKVLALNFFEELRLAEIGRIMNLSEARVSQIRAQALATLRKFVRRMTY